MQARLGGLAVAIGLLAGAALGEEAVLIPDDGQNEIKLEEIFSPADGAPSSEQTARNGAPQGGPDERTVDDEKPVWRRQADDNAVEETGDEVYDEDETGNEVAYAQDNRREKKILNEVLIKIATSFSKRRRRKMTAAKPSKRRRRSKASKRRRRRRTKTKKKKGRRAESGEPDDSDEGRGDSSDSDMIPEGNNNDGRRAKEEVGQSN